MVMDDISEREYLEKELRLRLFKKDVIIACDDLGIDLLDWVVYFGDINPYHADCKMCLDYLDGICDNISGNPIECIKGKKFINTDMVV